MKKTLLVKLKCYYVMWEINDVIRYLAFSNNTYIIQVRKLWFRDVVIIKFICKEESYDTVIKEISKKLSLKPKILIKRPSIMGIYK